MLSCTDQTEYTVIQNLGLVQKSTASAFDSNTVLDEGDNEAHPLCKWKEHQFWLYVDGQLMEVCKLTTQHVQDKREQDSNITEYIFYHLSDNCLHLHRFFTTVLQEDWKKYPFHLVVGLALWGVQLSFHFHPGS